MSLESIETRPFWDALRGCHAGDERRARRRVRLRSPLSILKTQARGRVLCTITENLSSRGFCCILEEPLAVGENLACVLGFSLRFDPEISQGLCCQAQVVWVKMTDDGRFGIGCRIDDYTVVA